MRKDSSDRPARGARFSGAFIVFSLSAALLGVLFFALFFRAETVGRRSSVEYRAFQILTALVDMYHAGMPLDPLQLSEVSGFGVYAGNGESLYRYGSAPGELENPASIPIEGSRILKGASMTIIRRMGSVPGMRPMMQGRFRNGSMMPGMGDRQMPQVSVRQALYAWVDLDVSESVSESRLALVLLGVFLCVFALFVLLAVYYARKLSVYRERERKSAHLVQLGEAARTLAHEIKNPLGVIRLQCAMLRRTVPEERLRNIGIIEEETGRLAGLSDRIREFLDNSEGKPVLVRAGDFLDRCKERYGERLSIPDSPFSDRLVCVDPDRLTQILDNFVSNAFDSGGSTAPELSLSLSGSTLSFTVSDSGSGVAPADRDRLFELFFTTKAKGSGIGLALARKYARQAGGDASYAPRNGGGSEFSVSLPAAGGAK